MAQFGQQRGFASSTTFIAPRPWKPLLPIDSRRRRRAPGCASKCFDYRGRAPFFAADALPLLAGGRQHERLARFISGERLLNCSRFEAPGEAGRGRARRRGSNSWLPSAQRATEEGVYEIFLDDCARRRLSAFFSPSPNWAFFGRESNVDSCGKRTKILELIVSPPPFFHLAVTSRGAFSAH